MRVSQDGPPGREGRDGAFWGEMRLFLEDWLHGEAKFCACLLLLLSASALWYTWAYFQLLSHTSNNVFTILRIVMYTFSSVKYIHTVVQPITKLLVLQNWNSVLITR